MQTVNFEDVQSKMMKSTHLMLRIEEDKLTMDTDISIVSDSLSLIELSLEMEDEFGFAYTDEEVEKLRTIGDFVNVACAHLNIHTENELTEAVRDFASTVVSTDDPDSPSLPVIPDAGLIGDRIKAALVHARLFYMLTEGGDNLDIITPYDKLIHDMENQQ